MTMESRAKILIVDDDKQNIEMLAEVFRAEHRVTAALNAQRALRIARSDSPPDLILLDIIMPEMNGYELCTELKKDDRTKSIPVIFVTAVSEVMDAAKGFALGAVDYITKPFHPPMVQARVRLHLELKRKYELLETFAFIDAVTEIPNRRSFNDKLNEEWNRSIRSNTSLSLLIFDLDHFKAYNDTYGHGQGDKCLREIAQKTKMTLRRAGDFIARYGGEEFAIILPNTTKSNAEETAQRLVNAVDELNLAHKSSPTDEHVTISIGISSVTPTQEMKALDLVAKADDALYEAKGAGRHCIRYID